MNFGSKYLNEVAQELKPRAAALELFIKQEPVAQFNTLRQLAFMCREAAATRKEARKAIDHCRLPPGFHPLWRPGRREVALCIVTTRRGECILNEEDPIEYSRQFEYMMELFVIADARRRVRCGKNCQHWWHQLESRIPSLT